MESFKELIKCKGITKVQQINDQYDYEDVHPHGKGDNPHVSCGQKNGYNELENILNGKLAPFIKNGKITYEEALEALCMTCKKLPNPRERKEFYKILGKILGITISYP